MAKKQKIFKYLLASSAIASVITSLGSSNVAFGADPALNGAIIMRPAELNNDGVNTWQTINDDGTPGGYIYNMHNAQGAAVVADNKPAITYSAPNLTLNADMADAVIRAINLAHHIPGVLKVSENLSIGSIVSTDADGKPDSATPEKLLITVEAGKTLTLTGTDAVADRHGFVAPRNTYTALGNVTLAGDDAANNATTLIVHAGNTIHTVTAAVGGEGILIFEGAGGATGNIGADGNPLKTINIVDGAVTLGNVWATNTNLTHANSILNVRDDGVITGNVDNTTAAAAGILNFTKAGTVTQAIGATKALAEVNFGIAAAGGGDVELRGTATATNFNINHADVNVTAVGLVKGAVNFVAAGKFDANAGIEGAVNFDAAGTVKIGGNFTGAVDFDQPGLGAVNGTLEFNGAAAEPYTFNSIIAHGDHGTLNVKANLKATNADIGKIHIINIGDAGAGNNKTLKIDASAGNVTLLARVNDPAAGVAINQKINFLHVDSVLHLYSNVDRTITFADNLSGGIPDALGVPVGHGGIVWLEGDAGNTLIVQSATGAETLGVDLHKLGELRISRQVTIAGDANELDVHNAGVLNIIKGATFTDESTTSAQIAEIHIGAAGPDAGAVAGPATYVLDAVHGNVDIPANNITFDHEKSRLVLRNSHAGNKTITLQNDLDPDVAGAAGVIYKGEVEFNSVHDGKTLTIGGVGRSLVIAGGHNLKTVIFSGDGLFQIVPTINSKNIELHAKAVTLGDVNSSILFTRNTVLTANGNIVGDVDFQNNDGTIILADGKGIGRVTSTGGVNGTLEFQGAGRTGPITNLKRLKAGAGAVRLDGGNYNITEIQGNGVGNLIFADNFNLTGSINSSAGGAAVGLIFEGNSGVSGVVGTKESPVGTIQVRAGVTKFGNKVQTGDNQDIIISARATAVFTNIVTIRDIKGAAAGGQGIAKFINATPITINSTIGAGNSVDTLEIAGADVDITQAVSTNNISFSNTQSATLTLRGTNTVGGIRTVGNNVHTLALAADFTTGGQDIGSEKNRLKSIELLGDYKITLNNSDLYSSVSTKTNNTGKVVFNSGKSSVYDLGTDKLRLSDVTFSSNATVKGDVYSKQITIVSDKTATFAGTKNRTLSVPSGGNSRSRLLRSFAYNTQIGSDGIKNEGIAKFDNAVLLDAKINGGKVTFADNVWFKQTADGKEVNFAANKYVLLEQNISFANIKADQAKIIVVPKTAAITGDLAAKDFTVDLAANKLQYTGKAQLTGKIELVTAYDASSGVGGNIEIQKDSKLDLSKADQLIIKVNAQTDVNKIPKDANYVVISSVDGNGLVAIDNSKISLDSTGEQNRFVKWSMDSSDLKLYITDISREVLTKDSAKYTPQEQDFVNQLLNATGDAAKFKDTIGNMDEKNAHLAIEKLLAGNEHPIGENLARTSEIMDTSVSQNAAQIASRQSVRMHNPASNIHDSEPGIGSGDDDQVRYGVWGSPFYGTACQEMYQGVSGYKSKSAGGIVGLDGLVNDDLLLGVAYSRIDTQMSHQDQKAGDKTSGKTNIFSLYSLYNLPNNWFTETIASYGLTRVKNSEGRLVATKVRTVAALETAAAKYKSVSYSGQLLAGYNYRPSGKLMITPTIGFRYLQFNDDGYKETGTKFQNLAVKKRSYNKFEGILGLRTATTLKVKKVLLIPELHGYVNHDFKGKAPIIDARLDGVNEPLPTRSAKPAKTSFTVGTGLTAKYNMMECGVTYNVNIANKYMGHQGSLKVKVNF